MSSVDQLLWLNTLLLTMSYVSSGFSSKKEILADGFTSYVDPPIDVKSIVTVSLVGINCLQAVGGGSWVMILR